jgi:hypothetical protein
MPASPPSQMRDRAQRLCETEPAQALKIARHIPDPWFGCQSLSWVGRYWPDAKFIEILQEAFEVAARASDPYQTVAASAWPVRALLERGAPATTIARRTLPLARGIENLGGRSEALILLFQATLPYEKALWTPVLDELVIASEPVLNWRQRRNFRSVVQLLLGRDADLAAALAGRVSDEMLRRAADKALKVGAAILPRPFFWRGAQERSQYGVPVPGNRTL